MAGRGTDIKVTPEVVALSGTLEYKGNEFPLGGLFVIGTEKHETRRIDNQLRGRSGRQGDPGFTQFMIAPSDDIMRIFGGDRLSSVLNSSLAAGTPDDEPIMQSTFITNRITSVQKQVEGRNFDIRKHILEYDDVLNQHRLVMYGKRNRFLEGENIDDEVLAMFDRVAESFVEKIDFSPENLQESLVETVAAINHFAGTTVLDIDQLDSIEPEALQNAIREALLIPVNELNQKVGNESFFDFEKRLVLGSFDELWMNHIDRMAHLREEVAFEGYAQKQPLVVYKERAYDRFVELVREIEYRVVKALIGAREVLQIAQREIAESQMIVSRQLDPVPEMEISTPAVFSAPQNPQNEDGIRVIRVENKTEAEAKPAHEPSLYKGTKRNDACPCGSGKKFKHCHGK
jgi:preprotein translocase subunit SecA